MGRQAEGVVAVADKMSVVARGLWAKGPAVGRKNDRLYSGYSVRGRSRVASF